MGQDLFAYLPSEVIIHILSLLPVRTIIKCTCVCKAWLSLVKTDEFVKYHHSRAVPKLAAFSMSHRSFHFEDGFDQPFSSCHDLLHIGASVNGFLFVRNFSSKRACVLNPIARDCITFYQDFSSKVTCGFGISRITGKYKVVRIFGQDKCYCQVYTIGTKLWRPIQLDARVNYSDYDDGAFLNGNLHWLVRDRNGVNWISCLDLESELFSTFSPPHQLSGTRGYIYKFVAAAALEGCLCLCDTTQDYGVVVIWLMKKYGDEKSWAKEFVINTSDEIGLWFGGFRAIKVSRDGDMLMLQSGNYIMSYSKKNNTLKKSELFGLKFAINPIVYTPNFLSLASFENERVTPLHPKYCDHNNIFATSHLLNKR